MTHVENGIRLLSPFGNDRSDVCFAAAFGEHGRQRIAREFTWERFTTRFREILYSVVSGT
jgi:hypothetical protein